MPCGHGHSAPGTGRASISDTRKNNHTHTALLTVATLPELPSLSSLHAMRRHTDILTSVTNSAREPGYTRDRPMLHTYKQTDIILDGWRIDGRMADLTRFCICMRCSMGPWYWKEKTPFLAPSRVATPHPYTRTHTRTQDADSHPPSARMDGWMNGWMDGSDLPLVHIVDDLTRLLDLLWTDIDSCHAFE